MTRTYTRQETRWDIELLEQALSDGNAKLFVTKDGPLYVVKTEQGSFAVRTGQIIPREEKAEILANVPSTEEFNADPDGYLREAQAQGISVDEYTDGEYTVIDGVVRSIEEVDSNVLENAEQASNFLAPGSAEEDALLAKFL